MARQSTPTVLHFSIRLPSVRLMTLLRSLKSGQKGTMCPLSSKNRTNTRTSFAWSNGSPTCRHPRRYLMASCVLIDARGGASFYRLMAEMRTRWPNDQQMMFFAFDLLHQGLA